MNCICGKELKWVQQLDQSYPNVGDLRCISCGKHSGLCQEHEAAREFERCYGHLRIKAENGQEVDA